jgi:hypothetical protein
MVVRPRRALGAAWTVVPRRGGVDLTSRPDAHVVGLWTTEHLRPDLLLVSVAEPQAALHRVPRLSSLEWRTTSGSTTGL